MINRKIKRVRSVLNVLHAAPGFLAQFCYYRTFLMLIVSSGEINLYQQLNGHNFEYIKA